MSDYTNLSDAQIRNLFNGTGTVTYVHALVDDPEPTTEFRIIAKVSGVNTITVTFNNADEYVTVTVYKKTEYGTQIASAADIAHIGIVYDYDTQQGTVTVRFHTQYYGVVKLTR